MSIQPQSPHVRGIRKPIEPARPDRQTSGHGERTVILLGIAFAALSATLLAARLVCVFQDGHLI